MKDEYGFKVNKHPVNKFVIYVKNEFSQYIGTYLLKDSFKFVNDVLFDNNDKDLLLDQNIYYSGETNNNLRVLSAIYDDLRKLNIELNINELNKQISLKQVKCLGSKNKVAYYLVKINFLNMIKASEVSTKLNNFKALDTKDTLYKSAARFNKKYLNSIKSNKNKAIVGAFFAEFKLIDYIVAFIELGLIVLSVVTMLLERQKEVAEHGYNGIALGIFLISLIMVVVQQTKTLVAKIHKGNEFRHNIKLASKINGESKKAINDKITNNLTKKYNGFYCNSLNGHDSFLISNEENDSFDKNAERLKVNKVRTNIPLADKSRKALACIIGEKLNADKTIYNGTPICGINTDLDFSNESVIEIKKARYYNYVSSDELIYSNYYTPNDIDDKVCGKDICLNTETGGFLDIHNSHLTNIIGINVIVELILNNESYVIINQQSMYNDVNGRRYVPTASGSLDFNDYKKCKKSKKEFSFKDLLFYGMLRELKEESYIPLSFEKDINNLKLLGFSRLYSKSGKPDFFGKLTYQIDDVNTIDKILNNYNYYQNNFLGTKEELETIRMFIIKKDDLIKLSHEKFLSPQLCYVAQLLKREEDKINNK